MTNIFCAFLIVSFVSFSCFCHSINVPILYFSYLPSVLSQQLSVSYEILSFLYMSYMGPSYLISFNHLTWYEPTVKSISNIWQRQIFWYGSCINPSLYFKGEIPKITLWNCYNILCNSLSRGISRRAPYKNDFLVLMRYKTKHKCNVFL